MVGMGKRGGGRRVENCCVSSNGSGTSGHFYSAILLLVSISKLNLKVLLTKLNFKILVIWSHTFQLMVWPRFIDFDKHKILQI